MKKITLDAYWGKMGEYAVYNLFEKYALREPEPFIDTYVFTYEPDLLLRNYNVRLHIKSQSFDSRMRWGCYGVFGYNKEKGKGHDHEIFERALESDYISLVNVDDKGLAVIECIVKVRDCLRLDLFSAPAKKSLEHSKKVLRIEEVISAGLPFIDERIAEILENK